MLSVEDRLDITQLLNLYGHVIDLREWDRLDELFTEDLVFDSSDLNGRIIEGRETLKAGVGFKGRVGALTYKDVVRRTPAGWRISQRQAILVRPQPRPAKAAG